MEETTEINMEAIMENDACITIMTSLFEAMAFRETIRGVVEPKQNEVINFFKFKVRDEFKEHRGIEVVTEYKHLYMAEESDWALFDSEMVRFYKEQGIKHKEGCCPLLEAGSLVREVERHVINIFEPFTGISLDMLMYNLKQYKKYIELLLTLFAPVVKNNFKQTKS